MKLKSDSCCGRQRVSLKLELWSTAGFALSPHTCHCKQSGNISLLFYTSVKCNTSRPKDYFEFFNVYYVYDLHLIVSKFKAIRENVTSLHSFRRFI